MKPEDFRGVLAVPYPKRTHCKHGHEFTPENTTIDKHGTRRCRACNQESQRRYRQSATYAEARGVRVAHQRKRYANGEWKYFMLRNYALRAAAIEYYGGVCRCCGETREEFLVFDHVNGGGRQDRRGGSGGPRWWKHLIANPIREDLRVLCANCNMARERPGGCPHQR